MSREKVAERVSDIFNPYYLSAPFFLLVVIVSAKSLMTGIVYCVVLVLFFSALPVWDINRRIRRGSVSNPHIDRREDRIKPFLFSLTCAVAGLAAVYLAGAPAVMKAVSWSVVVTGAIVTATTAVWKVSLHAAGISAIAFILVALFGWFALPVVLCIPLVYWARFTLNKHTPAQLLVGSILAIGVTAGIFRWFGLV